MKQTTAQPQETPAEIQLAIGALFRMASRPTEPGDVERYAKIRMLILDSSPEAANHRPNYARHRMSGAAGD